MVKSRSVGGIDGPKSYVEKVIDDLSGPMYHFLFDENEELDTEEL